MSRKDSLGLAVGLKVVFMFNSPNFAVKATLAAILSRGGSFSAMSRRSAAYQGHCRYDSRLARAQGFFPWRSISFLNATRLPARESYTRPPGQPYRRENSGTVLATRSALTGSNRPVPLTRTAAQETIVRRAVAPAHARALRRNLDRR